jgi:hypothetical protein
MTLATDFGVAGVDEDDLYAARDWLLSRQESIQKKLSARHLKTGGRGLYDLSSSCFEGSHCPLARFSHERDGRKGLLQVNYGLMTDGRGCPVAVSVSEGNVSDGQTFLPELERLRQEFGIEEVVRAGDRGRIGRATIERLREMPGIGWITVWKSTSIRALVEEEQVRKGWVRRAPSAGDRFADVLSGGTADGVPESGAGTVAGEEAGRGAGGDGREAAGNPGGSQGGSAQGSGSDWSGRR